MFFMSFEQKFQSQSIIELNQLTVKRTILEQRKSFDMPLFHIYARYLAKERGVDNYVEETKQHMRKL